MNKKSVLIFFLITNVFLLLFSEDLKGKYYSDDGYFNFIGNQYEYLKIDMDSGLQEKTRGEFTIVEDSFENKIICFFQDNGDKKMRRYFVFEDFLLLYKDSEIPFFIGNSTSAKKIELLVSCEVKSSSSLKDNKRIYLPEKITLWGNLNYVWSEGVDGQGIGEKLFIKKNDIAKIYILPGYVSITRPDLYKRNSRPKKIKVMTNKRQITFSLLDKPEFQVLNFNTRIDEDIIIEILEVYPGSTFEDTCISSILCSR